jgi:predicted transcriptional regulator
MSRVQPPKSTIAAVRAASEAGRTQGDIARDYGVTRQTIASWLRGARERAAQPSTVLPAQPKRPGGRFAGVPPLRYEESSADEQSNPLEPQTALERLQHAAAERDANPEPEEADADTLTTMRRMLQDTLKRAREAEAVGNFNTAQKSGRDAAALVNTITRLERLTAADADVLRISRVEIEERRKKVRERIRATLDRPLLCAECNRKLSVLWGTGKKNGDNEGGAAPAAVL